MFYELKNPRDGIESVSIDMVNDRAYLCVKYVSGIKPDNSYPHKTLIAAKIYYATHWQSRKYNHPKPVWEEVEIKKEL